MDSPKDYTDEQVKALMEAVFYSSFLGDPDGLKVAADELDCDHDCPHFSREDDTNATNCRHAEMGGLCPWLLAEDLRAIRQALFPVTK